MLFTYNSYRSFLLELKKCGFYFSDYHSWHRHTRCVILRHDIDYDIAKAITMAELEEEEKIKSTYFVLITSDFYNVFSMKSARFLNKILEHGHEIGLHFDEVRYPHADIQEIKERIKDECETLSKAIDFPVTTVSMHRPSRMILEADLRIPSLVNSYGQTFFKEFKYVSDSRRNWREPVEKIIESNGYDRLHILTHPFWYNENEENLQSSLLRFINSANRDRYAIMNENFSRLEEEVSEREILGGIQ